MMIGLKRYCGDNMGATGALSRPVSHNGNTYITDGWLAIRTKGQLADAIPSRDWDKPDLIAKMDALFPVEKEKAEMRYAPIKIDQAMISKCQKCKGLGIVKVCQECNGAGVVETETEYNYYEHECKTCHGNCVIPQANEEKAEKCSYCKGFGDGVDEWLHPVCQIGKLRLSPDKIHMLSRLPMIAYAPYRHNLVHFVFFGGDGVLIATPEED